MADSNSVASCRKGFASAVPLTEELTVECNFLILMSREAAEVKEGCRPSQTLVRPEADDWNGPVSTQDGDTRWRADRYFEGHPFPTQKAAEYLRDAETKLMGIARRPDPGCAIGGPIDQSAQIGPRTDAVYKSRGRPARRVRGATRRRGHRPHSPFFHYRIHRHHSPDCHRWAHSSHSRSPGCHHWVHPHRPHCRYLSRN